MNCFILQILKINKTKGCWPCHGHGDLLHPLVLPRSAWFRSCLGKMSSFVNVIIIVIIIIVIFRIVIIIINCSPGRQHRKFLKQQQRHSGTSLDFSNKIQRTRKAKVILMTKRGLEKGFGHITFQVYFTKKVQINTAKAKLIS